MAADLQARAADLERRLTAAGHWVSIAGFTDTDGAAFILGIAGSTLRKYRADDCGPPWRRVGRVVYPLNDLLQWIDSR